MLGEVAEVANLRLPLLLKKVRRAVPRIKSAPLGAKLSWSLAGVPLYFTTVVHHHNMYITNFTIMFCIQRFERFTNYVSAYKGNTSPSFFILYFWVFTSVSEKPIAFIKSSSYTIVGQLEYLVSESGTLEQ